MYQAIPGEPPRSPLGDPPGKIPAIRMDTMGATTMDPAVTMGTITATLTVTTRIISTAAVQATAMATAMAMGMATVTVIRINIRPQPSLAIR